MEIRHFVTVAVMSAVATTSRAQETAPRPQIADADAGWSAIKQCAGIAKDNARLSCVDGVLRKAGLMPTHSAAPAAKSSTATPSPTGTAGPTASTAAPTAAKAAASSSSAQPQDSGADFGLQPRTFPKPPPKDKQASAAERKQEVTLTRVDQAGDGKLLLTTTEGAIWKQVESAPVRPVPTAGQTMTIEKATLGSFLCEPSKYVSFRCVRAQ
jgi:hypothetical protein